MAGREAGREQGRGNAARAADDAVGQARCPAADHLPEHVDLHREDYVKRISKKTREEAIELCLCRADEWLGDLNERDPWHVPQGLAWEAFSAIASIPLGEGEARTETAIAWLEAAALLHGDDEHLSWEPGHEVYLRSKP